jgi:hypothetical protein
MMVKLSILYSQLAIFSADLAQPYNDWNERHVAQGFSWRRSRRGIWQCRRDNPGFAR